MLWGEGRSEVEIPEVALSSHYTIPQRVLVGKLFVFSTIFKKEHATNFQAHNLIIGVVDANLKGSEPFSQIQKDSNTFVMV